MAKRKTTKTKGKAKRGKAKPRRAPKTKRRAGARAASSGTSQRIAQLEAENRRLREELDALRAEGSERAVPAFNLTADEEESATPTE